MSEDQRDYMEEAREAGVDIELTLTPEQVERYVQVVTKTGKDRSRALGDGFHDVDFAMGAMVILFGTGNNDKIPPAWCFNAMRGVPIFTEEPTSGEGSSE